METFPQNYTSSKTHLKRITGSIAIIEIGLALPSLYFISVPQRKYENINKNFESSAPTIWFQLSWILFINDYQQKITL